MHSSFARRAAISASWTLPAGDLGVDVDLDRDEADAAVGAPLDVPDAVDAKDVERDGNTLGDRHERHREARRERADQQLLGAPDTLDPALEPGRRGHLEIGLAGGGHVGQTAFPQAGGHREPV